MSSYACANVRITNEQKQKENSHEGITWSEMGKQNVQAKKGYSKQYKDVSQELNAAAKACPLFAFIIWRDSQWFKYAFLLVR